jgi:ABC-2 type transport system permease protein
MFGLSYAVIRDREHYRMLKYVYISPAHFQTYFLGRGLAQTVEGIIGAVVNVCVGLLLFSAMRAALGIEDIAWGWLAAYLAIGAAMFWACGMIIAAAMLNMSRSGMFLSEGVAGLVYLLSGVLFPISKLGWAENISLCLPTTYWLEGMRRALMGPLPESATNLRSRLTDWSHGELALALAGTTVVLMVVAQLFWRWSERRAWRLGKLEENTGV